MIYNGVELSTVTYKISELESLPCAKCWFKNKDCEDIVCLGVYYVNKEDENV